MMIFSNKDMIYLNSISITHLYTDLGQKIESRVPINNGIIGGNL